MSTFYATFRNVRSARAAVHELLRGGLDPDSISLIANDANIGPEDGGRNDDRRMREEVHSVGDATAFVGGSDDPRRDDLVPPSDDYTKYSRAELSEDTMGIDTSNVVTDVETADQSDDGQEVVDKDTYTDGHISQSEHERDDLNLALHTGFPTPIPVLEDDVIDTETPRQDQNDDALDTIIVPGFGLVQGGGALATAALDFTNPESDHKADALIGHLRDEGVPTDRAKSLREAFEQGGAVLAVEIIPGETNEEQVEEIAGRHGAQNVGMFDAPRYYQNGGKMPKMGGGAS